MKKIFTLLLVTSLCFSVNAQFSDDFESYNAGDYLAESSTVWSTWSGSGEGTDEDVQVTSDMANGGSNSIYLASTEANGGPQDLILPFGAIFSQGTFVFQSDFYIVQHANSGAYFNFQADTIIGLEGSWSVNCHMDLVDEFNNKIEFIASDGETVYLSLDNAFTANEWFTMRLEIDLNTNNWEVFINTVSQGNFTNTTNGIAAIDFFPLEGHDFLIDNVLAETPNTIDAALTAITMPTSIPAPASESVTGNITNLGNETITSMDITWTDGTDSYTDLLTGLNITTLDVYEFSHTDALVSNVIGSADITITVDNVNGGSDDDALNNEISTVINFTAPPASWNCETEGCVDPTDGSGEFNSLTLCMINCTVGVDELEDLNTLLTPNPTSDNTTLSFSAENMEVIVEIKNIAGQVVSTRNYGLLNGQQKLTLNTVSLPNGIYLIDMKVNGQNSVHKLVKQ